MNSPARRVVLTSFVVLAALALAASPGQAQVNLTTLGAAYSQTFDTLGNSGTNPLPWADNSTITGWYTDKTSYTYSSGTVTTGGVHSFGASGATDRALGSLGSNSAGASNYAVRLVNATGATINSLDVAYIGEQWRNGGNTTAHTLSFSYQVGATAIGTGTWTPDATLNFTGPIATSSAGALDGNLPANRVSLSATLTVTVPAGQEIWLRWSDPNDSGNDHGLSIDDFSVTPQGTVVVDTPPSVVSTVPTAGATGIAISSSITVTFTEPVTAGLTSFALECPTGSAQTFTVSGSGTATVTIDPTADLPAGIACDVRVTAAEVTDLDGTADPMASNYAWTFTTAAPPPAISLIHDIQGSGATSGLAGQIVRVRGIVVGDYQGASPTLGGFFVQEEDADGDGDDTTSEGVFVYQSATAVGVGDLVEVTGTVTEFGTAPSLLTELSSVSLVQVVSSGNALPTPAPVTFPVATLADLERFEGMLVTFPQPLTVIENYELGRYGSVSLSGAGRLPAPTHAALPGAAAVAVAAANDLSRIVLDDAQSNQNPDPVLYPAPGGLSATNTLRSGSTVAGLTGIFDERFNTYRVQPVGTVTFTASNPRPAALTSPGTLIRAVSMNALNYFNGDGLGGGFPTARGAETLTEFNRQRVKTIAAMTALDADIFGLMELENDDDSKADAATSAIEDLVNGLNAATAPGTFDFVPTGVIGGDAIRSAIVYKPGRVMPVGAHAILDESVDPDFLDYGNRPTIAQTFVSVGAGARFTFVVNHLRSKGSCGSATGGNVDSGDGQGCWNLQRTNAAGAIVDWLATDPTGSGDPDFLVVGDMNAYRLEDPITALKNGGLTDLIEQFEGTSAYSYVFSGEAGYIDHALSSSALTAQVAAVTHWHNNADEPIALDYNTNFKSAGQQVSFYAPDAYRAADHDPVVVDLDLAVNAAPTVDAGGPYSVTVGFTTPLTAAANDPNGDALTVEWDLDNNGTYETAGNPVTFSAVALLPGTYTVGVRATETASEGLSATDTATVTVVAGPAITSPASALFVAGTARTFTITTTGFPVPSITLVGTLPAGLTFIDNGDGTGTISGTAAPGTAGTYTVTVTASNGVGTPFVQTLTIQVTAAAAAATIPVLDGVGLGLLAALVALGGALLLGRRLS